MLGLLILGIILHQYLWGNSAPEDTVQVSQTETVQCAGQVPNTEDKTSTMVIFQDDRMEMIFLPGHLCFQWRFNGLVH